jgi:hypothetical protein
MAKEFSIGENRRVVVKKLNGEFAVIIEEKGSDLKCITLTAKRWATLLLLESQIDQNVSNLIAKQNVQFKTHIGGGFYISITTGYACVDFREFYYHPDKGVSATRHGIALRIKEWAKLKPIILAINEKYPTLANAEPCAYQQDHSQLDGLLACAECHPFQYEEMLHSQIPPSY